MRYQTRNFNFRSMHVLVLALCTFFINSCYISKPLETAVEVKINEYLPVSILNTGNSNFGSANLDADYVTQFMLGLKSELQSSNVITEGGNPQFEITFTGLVITESTKRDMVKDAESADNGKVFELTTLNLNASGNVKNISTGKTATWTASKDDSEKVTSTRSAGQMVTGQNKERNEYREKEFAVNEALSLASSCGRRSGVMILKEIKRF